MITLMDSWEQLFTLLNKRIQKTEIHSTKQKKLYKQRSGDIAT